MAIWWGGVGNALGSGLQQLANIFLQKAIMQKQPEWELEALKKKAMGVAEMTTPGWETMTPEQQTAAVSPLLKQLALPKPDFASQMGSGFAQALGNLMGMPMAQSSDSNMPIPPQPVQAPSAKVEIPLAAPAKGEIKVKLKSTGEVGFIPEGEFDESVYERM